MSHLTDHNRIPPFIPHVVGSAICVILSSVLLLLGVEGDAPITHSPTFLLTISIVAFSDALKEYHFTEEAFSVHYYFPGIKRIISWKRVSNVEFVRQGGYCYLFISLDKCPSFLNSHKFILRYISLHPIKLITILIPPKRMEEYLNIIRAFYPNLIISNTGDGLREP